MADRDGLKLFKEVMDCHVGQLGLHAHTFEVPDELFERVKAFSESSNVESPQPAPHAIAQSGIDYVRGIVQREILGRRAGRAEHGDIWHELGKVARQVDERLSAIDLFAQPAAVEPANVPKGWRLVPIEPTEEMVDAAWESDAADYVGEHKRIYNVSAAYSAMLAAVPSSEIEVRSGLSDDKAGLMRFGHHPDPAIDFCIEVESLEARLSDAKHHYAKMGEEPETVAFVLDRIQSALSFKVGADDGAVKSKQALRDLETKAIAWLQPTTSAEPARKAIDAQGAENEYSAFDPFLGTREELASELNAVLRDLLTASDLLHERWKSQSKAVSRRLATYVPLIQRAISELESPLPAATLGKAEFSDADADKLIRAIAMLDEIAGGSIAKESDHLLKTKGNKKPTIVDAQRVLSYALPLLKQVLSALAQQPAASDVRDAGRYRKMRVWCESDTVPDVVCEARTGEELDTAIDAQPTPAVQADEGDAK